LRRNIASLVATLLALIVAPSASHAQTSVAPAATVAKNASEQQFSLMIWESADQIAARTDAIRGAKYWEAFADFGVVLQQAGVLRGGSALRTGDAAVAVTVRHGRTATVSRTLGANREELGGYFVIAVSSRDEAVRWAARVPAALTGVVEVRPAYPAPTMMSGK
jgi:hypothetical protein